MSTPIALFLYDKTTTMAQPWLRAGYECWCVDIQHPAGESRDPEQPNLVRVGADLRTWLPPRRDYVFVASFSPCTNTSVSGARWFKEKGLAGLAWGLELLERGHLIAQWAETRYMLEHPVSVISSYWRKPDYTFDPRDYGGYLAPGVATVDGAPPQDAYTKKTCLWTGGGFVMPPPKPVPVLDPSWIHHMPPSEERANLRSATPAGFAQAVFEANHPWVEQEVSNAA